MFSGCSKGAELSKAEYLKQYLSAGEDDKKSKGQIKKKGRKVPERRLKIVDDDIDWRQEVEEEEDEAPMIVEVIDERPDDIQQLEAFRTGNRWKVIGADEDEDTVSGHHDLQEQSKIGHDSPPRRPGQSQGPRMLSGGKAGLVSVDVLRNEKEENRKRERHNQPLEDESRKAQTVFRDKNGKRRDLDVEREEQKRKAGQKAAKDENYARWGRGLAQGEMDQQKLEYALHEAQKPLARHHDDEDMDRMLREQERDGDPMAAMLRRKKTRSTNAQVKPQYKGPTPPPNRFNIPPGCRWDGVDRSNGCEQKRYTRIADKKAVQEAVYKRSVEDM